MEIYHRINKLCEEFNINGTELGAKLGLKKSPLTDWKNGKSKPTVEQIAIICEIFAISADYIIFGKNTQLSKDESELLDAYNRATGNAKIAILLNAKTLAPSQDESSESRTG